MKQAASVAKDCERAHFVAGFLHAAHGDFHNAFILATSSSSSAAAAAQSAVSPM
jgi:hypothetical protein